MKINFKLLSLILVGVLIGLAIVGVFIVLKKSNRYYAVFLNNGNIYFGKLSTFPRLKLDNALFIATDQQGQASLARFKDAIWRPKGPIYFNKDAILFIAPIDPNSDLVKLIEGQTIPQQPVGQPPAVPTQPPGQQQSQPLP
jgi:hypothetical protein